MMDKTLEEISEEHWLTEVNNWVYTDVIYHLIITQDFYIRDSPEGMKWGELHGDNELKETCPEKYYPNKETLLEYHSQVKERVETYLNGLDDFKLIDGDGFSNHLPNIHEKLIYLLRHNAHHLGELALIHRTLNISRINWV
jgi:hypothetical protein